MKPIFDTSSKKLKESLLQHGRQVHYGRDEQIFSEGESARFLPIVLKGSVKMIGAPDIGKDLIIHIFGPGEMFAVPPVFDGGPYPASAFAIEESRLLQIARDDFLKVLAVSSEFAFQVISWMCAMLRDKTATIRNLAVSSPQRRIAGVLVGIVGDDPKDLPRKVSLRRQDIADMAGLTTETAIRTIRAMAKTDLVRIEHGKIYIDDIGPLREIVA